MEVRPLGSQGLSSPAQGYGCMGLTWAYAPSAEPAEVERTAEEAIAKALSLGINHLDTAWIYTTPGLPHNESVVGHAIAKHGRDKVIIADKIGVDLSVVPPFKQSAEDLASQLEQSLSRLGTDHIDILYLNRPSPFIPIEQTWAVMASFVAQGKAKYLGLIEATADDIRKAHAIHPLTAVQLEWSLFTRDAEAEVIPACRELGIGIVAYSPLSRGLLSGTIKSREQLSPKDWRLQAPRFGEDKLAANLAKVARLEALAQAKGVTPSQLALAWLHAQGKDVFPIPGSRDPKRIEENAGAVALAATLTTGEVDALAAEVTEADGDRYGHGMMGTHNMRRQLQAKSGQA